MNMPLLDHIKSEDFTDWMDVNLRSYYKSRIGYLRSVIEEQVPKEVNSRFSKIAHADQDKKLSMELIDRSMYQPMREYIKFSGKLFRPLLTCLFLEAYGKDPDEYKPIIAISEIIHSSSLMLDDIADASLTRRGSPCAHLTYGIPRAANASCSMTFLTFQMIRELLPSLDTRTKNLLYEMLLWEHYVTNLGSALDLGWAWERRNSIPEDAYIQHIIFRSCSYTYRHAARLGAIVGGADSKNLEIVFQYATLLGLAFQLIDDILNLKPGLNSWGKSVGEDITEGKRSLLVLYCIQNSSEKDKTRLLQILDDHVTDHDLLQEAIAILDKYQAFSYVRQKARVFIENAIECLEALEISDHYKLLLEEFARYVIERKI